ncbi:MAG: alcohol dehydrogenase catalytic domain-containing protein [Verrucomicrobiae bacterium]|nr:alcohol dehydrogenase catalytic domain-containing protein [Verrucomicrobiae bacterium]MDW7979774.1 alcohol dehydrogenase catalytic domain-containing protein [Verrucomicrobiales bacterium]
MSAHTRNIRGVTRQTMRAARLHGPGDLRVDAVRRPAAPRRGEALLRVSVTTLCGSDLHSFLDGRIGDTPVPEPLILGHEFSAVVEAVGPEAIDGFGKPLRPGARVAVDPAQPCSRCDMCEQGHPNLCRNIRFCGVYPVNGSLCEWIVMPSRCCFPVPGEIDDETAALLEPLGVAIHAIDLAKIRPGSSVAVIGAGPIGLLIAAVAKLAGAEPVYVSEKLPWRLALAHKSGAVPIDPTKQDPVQRVLDETRGHGVDVAIEAAWGAEAIDQAVHMARPGARVVLVGIPRDDRLELTHSVARRKGLTILLSRRMKHCYPRAISLATSGNLRLRELITHRFPLSRAREAFSLNAEYRDNVVKVAIKSS